MLDDKNFVPNYARNLKHKNCFKIPCGFSSFERIPRIPKRKGWVNTFCGLKLCKDSSKMKSFAGNQMKSYLQLPKTLFRIQHSKTVKLRSHEEQVRLGRTSFDLKLENGLVLPRQPNSTFLGPNGMSLRPAGPKMFDILNTFQGKNVLVFRLHEGLVLPEGLIVHHEHTDHYSLQTTVPIGLDDFHKKLNDFFSTLDCQTKEQFFDEINDPDCQDN